MRWIEVKVEGLIPPSGGRGFSRRPCEAERYTVALMALNHATKRQSGIAHARNACSRKGFRNADGGFMNRDHAVRETWDTLDGALQCSPTS